MGPYHDANEVIVFGALWLVVDNQRTSEVGSRRRSSEVNVEVRQLSEHKERTFELYYTIVKRELICVNEEVKSDVGEKKCPCTVRRRQPEHMRSNKKWEKQGSQRLV